MYLRGAPESGNLIRGLQGRALIEVEAISRSEASGGGEAAGSRGIKRKMTLAAPKHK